MSEKHYIHNTIRMESKEMNFFRSLFQFLHNPLAAEDQNSPYVIYANISYSILTKDFGLSQDHYIPFEIVVDKLSCLSFDFIRRKYVLFIREHDDIQHVYASIAHETYHRITSKCKKKGLHKQLWINEVLAFQASQQVLCRTGHTIFAVQKMKSMYCSPHRLSIDELRNVKSFKFFFLRRSYPAYFTETVAIISDTLVQSIGWEKMCLMTKCETLPDWLNYLSEIERKKVSFLEK